MRAVSTASAEALLRCCDRSDWQCVVTPVGLCVSSTADSVLPMLPARPGAALEHALQVRFAEREHGGLRFWARGDCHRTRVNPPVSNVGWLALLPMPAHLV